MGCDDQAVWDSNRYNESEWCGQPHSNAVLTHCRCCAECSCPCASSCPGFKTFGCAGATNCEVSAIGISTVAFTEEAWCGRGLPGEIVGPDPEDVLRRARALMHLC